MRWDKVRRREPLRCPECNRRIGRPITLAGHSNALGFDFHGVKRATIRPREVSDGRVIDVECNSCGWSQTYPERDFFALAFGRTPVKL
jgi:hypothetical protein